MSNGPSVFYIKQGVTTPAYTATIYDANGNILNLTGASVNFQMTNEYAGNVVNAPATITNAALGQVSYSWASADTATPGLFSTEWKVTLSGGGTYIYPNAGYGLVQIQNDISLGYPALQPGGIWNTIRSSSSVPTNINGNNGDYWLNTSTYNLYGPKVNGIWPTNFMSLGGGSGDFNVKNPVFGAKGDGVTDDTTAIQNALNAAAALTTTGASGKVTIPAGIYLTGLLTIGHRTAVNGAGVGATTLLCKVGVAAGDYISMAAHAEMVTISNLRLQGNSTNGGQTNTINGIRLGGSWTYNSSTDEYSDARHRLMNAHIEYFTGDGVHTTGFFDSRITDVSVYQVAGNGFTITGADQLINCEVENCKLDGLYLNGSSGALVTNFKARNAGIYNGTNYVTSSGTVTGNGIVMAFSSATITNAYALSCGRAGYYFIGAFNVNAANLTADSCNNNSSSTSFCGFDFTGFSGPLNATNLYAADNGLNTQHMAAAANIDSNVEGAYIELGILSNGSMSSFFSGSTTSGTLNNNVVSTTTRNSPSVLDIYGNVEYNSNVSIGNGGSYAGGSGVLGMQNATVLPSTTPTNGIVKYATAGFAKYRGLDGSDYQGGVLTLFSTSNQTLNTNVSTNVTGLAAAVAAVRYMIIGSVCYTATGTASTPVFSFTGPSTTQVALSSSFDASAAVAPQALGTLAGGATGPVLASSTFVWNFSGIIQFSGAGTLQLQGKSTLSSNPYTIQTGSYFLLIPLV